MRALLAHPRLHWLLLLLWTMLGLCLRLMNLTAKPLWTDEFATLVFSLGNTFTSIPLGEVITPEQLLQPLQANPGVGVRSVIRNLLNQSNHPPLYFALMHYWLKLFPSEAGESLVFGARSFSALWGTLSIPAVYGLGTFAFRSRLVGQLAAAFMAVSPFGIYLAQEARHYTLPILWMIASLACLVSAARTLRDRSPLSGWLCCIWIVVNVLGIATHYFVVLALLAQAVVITTIGLVQSWKEQGQWHPFTHWWRVVAVALGTIAGGAVWLPYLQDANRQLSTWIIQSNRSGLDWLDPIGQALAGWISMIYLLPIQAASELVAIGSGLILLAFTLWTVPKVYQGLTLQFQHREPRLAILVLGSYTVSAIVLFFGITYFLARDLTSAFRYNFVYFPAIVLLFGAGLAPLWTGAANLLKPNSARFSILIRGNARSILIMGFMSLLGALTVVSNLGYQKTHRPDVVVQDIQTRSQGDTLIAIAHQTHGQTGRLMGIAWELQYPTASPPLRASPSELQPPSQPLNPKFLLAPLRQDERSIVRALRAALNQSPRPLDLWIINFRDIPARPIDVLLERQNCEAITKRRLTDGYRYRLYRCSD